jgi:hypothetical protein
LLPNTIWFDDPTMYTVSGEVFGGQAWPTNTPTDMTGRAYLVQTSPSSGPEILDYGLTAVDDAMFQSGLTVNGILQSFNTISTSDGTVVALDVNYAGFYENTVGAVDFPTLVISPPAAGTQATATVTGMGWDGNGAILSPGTGYASGQLLTIVGGTGTSAAQFRVTSVDGGGGVLTYHGSSAGSYSVYPPTTASVTGGTGSGCTINPLAWYVSRNGVTINNPGSGYIGQPGVTFSTPLSGRAGARAMVIMGQAAALSTTGISSKQPLTVSSSATITGSLILGADPTAALQAATKQYVDAHAPLGGPYLPIAGGTLTGLLTLSADPSSAFGAATKQYVDNSPPLGGPYLPLATGGTVAGVVTFTAATTFSNNANFNTTAQFGSSTGAQILQINGPAAATNRILEFASASVTHWRLRMDTVAESGSNVGGNFVITRYSDTATLLGTPLTITRSNGNIALGEAAATVTVAGTLAVSAANGVTVGAAGSGPTIRSGTGAATGTQPSGSMWVRTDGTVGARVYVSAGAGTWNPIAGV